MLIKITADKPSWHVLYLGYEKCFELLTFSADVSTVINTELFMKSSLQIENYTCDFSVWSTTVGNSSCKAKLLQEKVTLMTSVNFEAVPW